MKTENNHKDHIETQEELPLILKQIRQETNGFIAPDGYFDSLSDRISGKLKKNESIFLKSIMIKLREPVIWSPVFGILIVFLTLIFLIPDQKQNVIGNSDSISEYVIATDISFAEDLYLSEANIIETSIENSILQSEESLLFNGLNQVTAEEMAQYLKDQEIETELLTEN